MLISLISSRYFANIVVIVIAIERGSVRAFLFTIIRSDSRSVATVSRSLKDKRGVGGMVAWWRGGGPQGCPEPSTTLFDGLTSFVCGGIGIGSMSTLVVYAFLLIKL